MERVLSLIAGVRASLYPHLESSDAIPQIDLLEKKHALDAACATLEWKFRMLSHCVAILYLLSRTRAQSDDKHSIGLSVEEKDSHTISCPVDLLHTDNVICTFYNMLTLSVSLQDAIATLIWDMYGEQISADYTEGEEIRLNNLTLHKLGKKLAQDCPLGVVINNHTSRGQNYAKIIELRNFLVHRSLAGVLVQDPINPHSILEIESRWTATGQKIPMPLYAEFVYRETFRLIRNICGCIRDNPATCIEKTRQDSQRKQLDQLQ